MDAFEMFWEIYPHHVGKLAAQKAFRKALKGATVEQIIDGVRHYKRTKPGWQSWAYPASWLNAGRWMDDVAAVPARLYYEPWMCPHTPICPHRAACECVSARHQES